MSEPKNGKKLDFEEPITPPGVVEIPPVEAVYLGDRFKFTFDAFDYIMRQPEASTVVVVLSEIKIEKDGSKTLIVVPE